MKVFLEIGYTNSKVISDNSEELTLLSNSSFDLTNYLNQFDFINNKLYVLNNNINFNSTLNSFKHYDNFFLFDHNSNKLDLKISPNINNHELGDDLRFLIYYMGQLESKDIVLMSNGSCLVTIVKQDNLVISISINLGTSTSLEVIKNNYGLTTDRLFFNNYATSTNDALALGEFLMLKGILISTIDNFKLNNYVIILCGNGYNKEWVNHFQNETKLKLEYHSNLVLKTFKEWCLNNLKW